MCDRRRINQIVTELHKNSYEREEKHNTQKRETKKELTGEWKNQFPKY